MDTRIEIDNRPPLEKFDEAIKILAEECGRKLSDNTINHYYLSLNKYHIDTVCHVIRTWTRGHSNKLPSVGQLLNAVKANSPKEYAERQNEDLDKQRKLDELEKQFTLLCKQICANGINTKELMKYPAMKRLMQLNGKTAQELNRDYSAYKTDLTTEQLYDKQNELRKQMSDLMG